MTIEELKVRISKKEADIVKIEKRIDKWTKGMNDEAKSLAAECELLYDDAKLKEVNVKYREYKNLHEYDETVFNKEWNKGPQLGEAYSAYRDLAEAKATLNKYNIQLDKINNFNNKEKIEVIWNFLQEWRKNVREFIIKNAVKYCELKSHFTENRDRYFKEHELDIKSLWERRRFEEKYYSDIAPLTMNVYLWNSKVDEERLDKILDKEVVAKYDSLVNRITAKAGEIVSADGLYIANNGEINGIVVGNKARVRVETITAGGYNIQILHYRVLVHIIK